jgi:CRISPR-associated protein Cmr4
MTSRNLLILTRTPLHVGAGASVGAIDQPIQRERHTGFPIIPASSLKGSFADAWNDSLPEGSEPSKRRSRIGKDDKYSDAAWLFGSDVAEKAACGALLFGEARILAFPIRSAKGSFAWITCPLALQRAARDGVLPAEALNGLAEPGDESAVFDSGNGSVLAISDSIALEDYKFSAAAWLGIDKLGKQLAALLPQEPIWQEVSKRIVVVSNGMMSFFARSACEVAQHVRISDETGTAERGGLFNQENVPADALFYSTLRATQARVPSAEHNGKTPDKAIAAFDAKLKEAHGIFQFGGDASTGLGYCSVTIQQPQAA